MTVRIPDFKLDESTHIGVVVLKVANLESMAEFYRDIIGLEVITENSEQITLGVADRPLLTLKKIVSPAPASKRTGLYHVAFLLPNRAALGDALLHYLKVAAPIIGASDHGYSEAIYLTDPEGNGIEVYRDKPQTEWDIRSDGEIVGVTIEMDADGVIAEASRNWRGFPKETIVGHVHLKVADLAKTEDFYTDVLGLTLKNNFGHQAKFFATGTYHHHIGSNIWLGRDVPAMSAQDLGLEYYSFVAKQQAELSRIEEHWLANNVSYDKDSDNNLWIIDPNGIKIKFEVENL